jgi:hypothetical protein
MDTDMTDAGYDIDIDIDVGTGLEPSVPQPQQVIEVSERKAAVWPS